ncbi:MAG: prealbumin-like fold domain-containing protein, partial [Anaerolineales bacterium]|nr:prealbumin-like fold domain-containing protein [Anaerolineales bacterium]
SASATGTKSYVAGSLTWFKVDQGGSALGGATFEACRITESDGVTSLPEPVCVTVLDNQAPDADPTNGVFKLVNQGLGTWTVQETVAPQGYFGDFDRFEQRTLSTAALDAVIAEAWVNDLFPGRTLETGTTCEMFRDGTAIALNQVLYGTKGKTINNAAPGVFFYYTKFIAPAADFTVDLHQQNNAEFVNFLLQNEQQVRLFNGDCSSPSAGYTITFGTGQVSVHITGAAPGQVLIMSVKYETSSVVGQNQPGEVRYDFHTDINGVMVDQDMDGLFLRKK